MALVMRVGAPGDIFTQPFATHLVRLLEHHFGTSMELHGSSDDEGWASIELGYSWLNKLQDHARTLVDENSISHLLSMSSWRGAFLPVETGTGELSGISEPDEPIAIASLLTLATELQALAVAMGVPPEASGCETLIHSYVSNDDRADDDPEIQTLAELIIGTEIGLSRRQRLWVVK